MKKIMVVDDSLMARINLKKMLEKSGYEVVAEACNGQEAVDKYGQFKPDLTTLDITMPVMDGISALKEIRKTDSQACIIMISALGQEQKIIDSLNNGARHYIQKPFNEMHALSVIQSVLYDAEESNVCDAG